MVRRFNLKAGAKIKQEDFNRDVRHYFKIQLDGHADMDNYLYENLVGSDLDSPESRAAYFYTENPPLGYAVDFPNP